MWHFFFRAMATMKRGPANGGPGDSAAERSQEQVAQGDKEQVMA